jgi:hypothetical protein
VTESESRSDWLSAIANRSKEEPELVREVLSRHNIRQSPSIGKPRRLLIRKIQFSGKKSGNHNDFFEFDFQDLKPGLWGLISDRNLKGKTSVLEIVRWLLRGKSSSKLQDGVKSWIAEASLDFQIDTTKYTVHLVQTDEGISGKLIEKSEKSGDLEVSRFASEYEFEACMSDFMMKELSLDVLSAWRKQTDQYELGKLVSHDWSAISGVLFIGGDYQAIFGDVPTDGLNNRLMNMYLGLPWIPTFAALTTVEKKLQEQTGILSNQSKLEQNQQQERRTRIERELAMYRSSLEKMPSDADVREALGKANQAHHQAMQNLRELQSLLSFAKQEYDQIHEICLQDQKDYQNFREAKAASAVFKQLEPTCCPHCQTSISDDRRLREIAEHSCSICGENITDSEDADILEEEFKNRLDASKKAFEQVRKQIASEEKNIHDMQAQASYYENECKRLEYQLGNFESRYEVEKKIAGLEFLLDEYQDFLNPSEVENKDLEIELKVIKQAIEETKRRINIIQKGLLEEASEKIKEYAIRFGMTSVTSVILTSNPHLKLGKDGGETTYSKCTDGEKLRLKVASIIALISIAEKKGIGRHPGLLLIDSPRSEEMVEDDVNQLIGGLSELTQELPYLQVIVAATSSESILSHIDETHRKYAQGDSFLW